ncbi:MAG: hypothetical protein CME59_16135 [Halioglobus sp.]|nr:hypothetical protein [Halioglobus sp.]|tara:strand:- start:6167 stop:6568 length:402 start_codon:yes stop_codon:yes gene_type:complete
MAELTTPTLWELFKNGVTWLSNLKRASQARKKESRKAVRSIITAARETAVYMREMNDTGQRNHGKEARLSTHWTTLGFELQDLGIDKLAKRCQIKGKYWSDPDHYDGDFMEKADVSLERMERLAREILAEIDK